MLTRQDIYTVKTFQAQPNGNIRLHCLMQYLQETAALHATQLGFGNEHLEAINCYWVLSNFKIEITRLPQWNEEFQIITWPSGYNRLIATREFLGKDKKGEELFKAGSEWMMLDKNSGRPRNLKKLDSLLPTDGQMLLEGKMPRLEPEKDKSEIETIRVPFSAIDLNGHVNNTEYVRWAIDVLKRNNRLSSDFCSIQVTYLSEVYENDSLNLYISNNAPIQITADKSSDQTPVFVMQLI